MGLNNKNYHEMNNKENYLEIHVEISTRARWYLDLQGTMARLYVRCRKNRFHITSLFMHDDTKKDELKDALSRLLFHRSAPNLTFNKLDVFTNRPGTEHIVNLTSTNPEVEFQVFVESLRKEACRLGIGMEPFRLHVTLARVPVDVISLEELKKIIGGINVREFTLPLTTLEYRYRNPNLAEGLIGKWKLKPFSKV